MSICVIIPVPKKGNLSIVDNYRGITLLSTLGKLFTRILNNRLCFWSDCYNVLIDVQMGFRHGFSTVDNMFVLRALIDTLMSQKKKLYCAFVDFRKAFDYVNRDCLWYKLLKNGIRGPMFDIIRNMYANVKSKVKFNGTVSSSFDCCLGVRQGESLSPFLFSLFINDMESELLNKGVPGVTCDDLKLCMLLYADDSVIFADTRNGLQEGLDFLHDYCQKWRLTVNSAKTKVLVFRRGGSLSRDDHWFYGDCMLEVVSKFCYLGIVFSTSGKFSTAQQTLADKARKAIFSVKNMTRQFFDLKPKFMCFLFDKMILPVLSYGQEIWGFGDCEAIERVHLQFCKGILKLRRSTAGFFVYGELGRFPLAVKRNIQIVKYWLKIVMDGSSPLVYKTYCMLYNATETNRDIANWASSVKLLLTTLGMGDVWLYQGVGNVTQFLKLLEQRLKDNAKQLWGSTLRNSSDGILYRECKLNFGYSSYLDNIRQPKYRYQFVKFLTRNHKLACVTGSWHKPQPIPIALRLCSECHVIEDEYHVVMTCKKFRNFRRRYISDSYWRRPSMHNFISLLTSTNEVTIQNLAIFVYKMTKV